MAEEERPAYETPSSPEEDDATPVSPSDLDDAEEPSPPPIGQLFSLDAEVATDDQLQEMVNAQLTYLLNQSAVRDRANVLVLHDSGTLHRGAANRIYSSVSAAAADKPILLVLQSPGGDVSTAYFIAKLCREHTDKTFEVAIPRQAKSAATLICCGADKLHMGSLSELGPIDPQFGGVPALALKHSVEHLAELVSTHPDAADMLSDYLAKSLRVEALGYYERVAESATHYAIRLLKARKTEVSESTIQEIARRLVYAYKDHSFAIDYQESRDIFGNTVVVRDTEEYHLGNELYQALDFMGWYLENKFRRDANFIGDCGNACMVFSKRG